MVSNLSSALQTCADYIVTNLFGGYVRVMFSNGNGYTYRARKRDILRLMTNENISLGFWINNCLNLDNTSVTTM